MNIKSCFLASTILFLSTLPCFSMRTQTLVDAAKNDAMELVQELIQQGAIIDEKDDRGRTSLHYAVINGNLAMVSLLLDKGADHTIVDNDNRCLLDNAVFFRRNQIVLLLLKKIDVNSKGYFGYTPLHTAALQGNKDMIEMLLKNGADPNMVNVHNETPLALAKRNNILASVELLIGLTKEDKQEQPPSEEELAIMALGLILQTMSLEMRNKMI
jgi:ankyrin repeat protein